MEQYTKFTFTNIAIYSSCVIYTAKEYLVLVVKTNLLQEYNEN